MPSYQGVVSGLEALLVAIFLTSVGIPADPAQATMYRCPNKPDYAQLQAKPGPGCEPIVEAEKEPEKKTDKKKEREPLAIADVEQSARAFMDQYRRFLACCATDPGSLEELEELEAQSSDIVKELEKRLTSSDKLRTLTVQGRGLVSGMTQVRDKLRSLKARLQRLTKSKDNLDTLDYESAGRERRKIQDIEESISRDFRPETGASRAPTGSTIGVTPPTGPAIGATAPTGTQIGNGPPPLEEFVNTPPGIERSRDNTLKPTAPVTTGTVGSDIGTTPTVGPDIERVLGGGSSTNSSARTGAAIGDSSSNR
jgi:hypothetical protein